MYISMSQLSDDVMGKAKSDIESQLASEGKPEQIWGKIVPGKISRFISDNTTLDQEQCLLDQNFIKDDKITKKKDLKKFYKKPFKKKPNFKKKFVKKAATI